jgi:hypothetical protein
MTVEVETPNRAPAVAARMADAAKRFLSALTDDQRRAAAFPFLGDERYKWNYRPMESMPRKGLWLIAMTAEQQRAAFALLETGLSARAVDQARRIMARESVLREHERIEQRVAGMVRDPELYWWSVFGEVGGADAWGWRVGGHHIGVHFTIVGGDLVSSTPLFLGCNPAEVRLGPEKGDRVLPAEEDMARDLLASLDEPRKGLAVYSPVAPSDIRTDVHRQVWPGVLPRGLALGRMDGRQRAKLVELIRYYLARSNDDLAGDAWRRVERAGLDGVTFAWAGPEDRGQGHYYAVSGPTFMLEYDNTQNGANHIHSVWREWRGDWGEDLLAAHYGAAHEGAADHQH